MVDRKTLRKGSIVWLGEMYCGRVRVEQATVRRAPRGRGGLWLDGCSRMLASEHQLFATAGEAYARIHENAQESLRAAMEEALAAEVAFKRYADAASNGGEG